MSELSKTEINRHKKLLQGKLAELASIQENAAEDRAPVTLDQTTQGRLSRMDALQVQAMALETDRRRELKIQRITAALGRISEGGFGYCMRCGDEIEKKRLNNDPSTPTCIGCAQAG